MRFIISGNNCNKNALPSYNDYILISRSNKYGANSWKHKFQDIIAKQIKEQCKRFYIDKPFLLNLVICESSKRRDKDNVESMAKKLILDTLQNEGLISNDKLYEGGNTQFKYDKESYIECELICDGV